MIYGGDSYSTPEHFFQAMKALDPKERSFIASRGTPGEAKRAGRKATLRPDWERIKAGVMEHVQRHRFNNEPGMLKMLLSTEGDIAEITTWHDRTWGKCICPKCKGRGRNMLGEIIMKIRREFAAREVKS